MMKNVPIPPIAALATLQDVLDRLEAKVTFPPNVKAVFGISNPYEWSFDVTATLNPAQKSGSVPLKTSIGRPINAQFVYLRSLPEAA
jgi:hypothetical protein